MSSEFDDHLKENKRKNTNPARATNLLIVAGFIGMSILMVFFMRDSSDTLTNLDVESTVNARLNEYIASQDKSKNNRTNPIATPFPKSTSKPSPELEKRPIIEGAQLNTGDSAIGTISDKDFEAHYTFDAQANTPYIITVQGIDLEEPEVVLSDSTGNRIISSTAEDQPIGTEINRVIGAILPDDGQYTITVTRNGGRSGDSEGDFTLLLDIPPSLNLASETTGVTSSNTWTWHTYQSDKPFSVVYNHKNGDYKPDVGVYTINEQSEFVTQSYFIGSAVTYSEVGEFVPNVMYFIAVGQSTIIEPKDSSIETSSYNLGIQIAQ
jgi:hypothetical protein